MKKNLISASIIYTLIYWLGYILISIDENIKIGDAYILYIVFGLFISIIVFGILNEGS